MGRAILPQDLTTWRALLEEHVSFAAVGRTYGVSGEAARRAFRQAERRAGGRPATVGGVSLVQWLPWTVKVKHVQNRLYRRRMFYARQQAGGHLSPAEQSELDEYLAFMEHGYPGVYEGPLSLVYWPETRDGFYAVPRRPSDVDGIRVE